MESTRPVAPVDKAIWMALSPDAIISLFALFIMCAPGVVRLKVVALGIKSLYISTLPPTNGRAAETRTTGEMTGEMAVGTTGEMAERWTGVHRGGIG
jgi:hypothetical protein